MIKTGWLPEEGLDPDLKEFVCSDPKCHKTFIAILHKYKTVQGIKI